MWSYNFDDMDFVNYPYSYYLFVPKNNKRLKVRVYFTKYEPQMKLNAYSNKENICGYTDSGEVSIKDGEKILEKIGYSDFYRIL